MKKLLVSIMVLFLALSFVSAQGQDEGSAVNAVEEYPTQAINLIVPFAAGGNSDFNARAIAKYLPKELLINKLCESL